MPLVPGTVPRRTETRISSQILDLRGKRRSASISVSAEATQLQIDLVLDAIGNASNGAQITRNTVAVNEVINERNAEVLVFDEAYPSTDQVAVFLFQNDIGDVQSLEIPAPDASLFEVTNRDIVDPTTVRSIAVIDATEAALNQGTTPDTFTFVRGYLATRRSSRQAPRSVPGPLQVVEPGAGDLPGAGPGLDQP